jgi:hypothetical protein
MLYHFSEDPNIDTFKPRKPSSFPEYYPVVFAIDKKHSVHYLFPRDCPRVVYWKADWSSKEDIESFFSNTTVDKIIVIENNWLDRIHNTNLFVYTFNNETFKLLEEAKTAVSNEEIKPVSVEPVGDLLKKILKEKIELRFTPNLHPIRDKVIASSLGFSIIRFRNAVNE